MATGSPTVRRKRVGQELARWRQIKGLTGEQVTKHMEWGSHSKLSRIERGQTGIGKSELAELLNLYGVTDEAYREELFTIAREGRKRGWWAPYRTTLTTPYSTYIGLEAEASELRCYEAHVVPGLLQTEDYARAVIQSGEPNDPVETVDRKISARLERQRLLTRDDPGPFKLALVLDESVIRRPIGGPRVMRDQLLRLRKTIELPNISVRILLHETGVWPGMLSSFLILDIEGDSDVVYIEGLSGDTWVEGEDVTRYNVAFETLNAAALGVAASTRMIERAAKEYGMTL